MSIRTKLLVARAAATMRANCARQRFGIELQPERGQLDRDVRVEAADGDLLESLRVGLHGLLALVVAGDILSEHVERGHAALGVERGDDGERFLERLARDVARSDPAHDRLRDERQRADDRRVESLHGASGSGGSGRSARDARAKHRTVTARAPAAIRRREHSRAVAPEVATSSTRSTRAAGRPVDPKGAAHVAGPARERQAALDLGLAALDEAAANERDIEPGRESRGQRLGRVIAPNAPRAKRRGHAGDFVGGGSGQSLDHGRGEPRREIVRAAELERPQDRASRARVGRGGAQRFEPGRVEQAAPADADASGAPGARQRLVAARAARLAARRQAVPAVGADSALEEAIDAPHAAREAIRRQDEAGRSPCELEQLSALSDSGTASVESKRRDCSLSRPGDPIESKAGRDH